MHLVLSHSTSLGNRVIAPSNDGCSKVDSRDIGEVQRLDQSNVIESLNGHNSAELVRIVRTVNNKPVLRIHKSTAPSQVSNVHEHYHDIDELALIAYILTMSLAHIS